MSSEASDPALGASYELLEPIGEGSTGVVWRARDRRTGEAVAAKVLHREHLDDDALVARFVRERSILMGLRHPNVVAVRDLVVERARLAVVMELLDGGSLRDVLRLEGTLPPALAIEVAAAVLDGLAAAHDRQVRHGDVKPDNVLLRPDWRGLRPGTVKLSDFGVAELLSAQVQADDALVGTPAYLAPEQVVRGRGGPAADVYGAGILLYELLGGRPPFAGPGDPAVLAQRHVTSEPPRLPLPGPVWDAVADLLVKDPASRPSAPRAAVRLRALAPAATGLPALRAQEPPTAFGPARGPATEVRGITTPGSTDPSPAAAPRRRR